MRCASPKVTKQEQMAERCQFHYTDLARATLPDTRIALSLRRLFWLLKRYVWYISVLGIFKFIENVFSFSMRREHISRNSKKGFKTVTTSIEALNLQPGELVEVRSEREIIATLDHEGKLNGLRFNPEMRKYCGKRFRVYKRVERMMIESTGELRTMRAPTVLLEGVFCDGEAHGGCDRSCFCFWREAWLKRVTPKDRQENKKQV